MSVLFNHAIRHELMPLGTNPITMVRQSAKRMQTPDILEAGELRLLFDHLSHRERVMVLLDSVTGLRRSELMALKWLDVDFEHLEISIIRVHLSAGGGPLQNGDLTQAGSTRSMGRRGTTHLEAGDSL